jgi:hypothetical protein
MVHHGDDVCGAVGGFVLVLDGARDFSSHPNQNIG